MQRSIAIIGVGATCLAWLHFYIKSYKTFKNEESPATIYVIEKRPNFGTGPAYEHDLSSNILNTKSGSVSPIHEKPGDFFRWIKENELFVKDAFPNYIISEDSYAPRALFGIYLQTVYKRLVIDAAEIGLSVVAINSECTDIEHYQKKYLVTVDRNAKVLVDYVFMLCGTIPIKPDTLNEGPDYVATPYPLKTLYNKIDVNDSVAIIGSRLSCIDTIIAMLENGHKGRITVFSASGYFPSVRGTQGRITTKILTDELIDGLIRQGARLSLGDITSFFLKELEIQVGAPVDFALPKPPEDISKFISDEINKSQNPRLWQAVLYATNSIIGKLWALLKDEDKEIFFKQYFSVFMAYRVSIPRENAIKILDAINTNILSFNKGKFHIVRGAYDGADVKTEDEQLLHFDKMISAVGSPRDARTIDSLLIRNLFDRKYITANSYGGLTVDPVTYESISVDGKIVTGLHILGELTNGVFFFTSALDINSHHAEQCCLNFFASHCRGEREHEYISLDKRQ